MDWVNVLYVPLLTDLTGNFQLGSMFKVQKYSNSTSKMSLLAQIQQNRLTSSNLKELPVIMLPYKNYCKDPLNFDP